MTSYVNPFTGDIIQPTDVSYAAYSISADLTLVWPINGNTSTDVVARIMVITPSTSGLSVLLPPANQVSVGQDTLVKNPSSYTLTIKDASGNVITTITAGGARYIYLTNNASTAGTWNSLALGLGTSSPDASALAGSGLLAEGTTLNQSHPTSSVIDGYTFVPSDRALTKIWGGGSGTATLPLATSIGDNWFTIFKNNGSGSYTISTTGSDTIDLTGSKLFQPNEAAIIICTGGQYVTVGYGTSTSFFFTALTKAVTSGNYTLSTSEATTIIQEYVGTLTGNVTVTYPPVVALYVVSNQVTSGGYTLTITTGVAGGANAVVPPGNQVTLICDGTNFFNANTVQSGASVSSLADGSVSNPSLYFASETDTGIYRPGAGSLGVTVLGSNVLNVSSIGIQVTGTGNFTGGIAGGTFV
jgi:hypothetical protein